MPFIVEKQAEFDCYVIYQSYIYEGCGEGWQETWYIQTGATNYITAEGTPGEEFISIVTAIDFNLSTTPQIIKPYKIELVIWPLSFATSDIFNIYIRELDQKASEYVNPNELYDDCFTANNYVNGQEIPNINTKPLVYDLGSLSLSDTFERRRQYFSVGITTDWQVGYNPLRQLTIASKNHATVGYRPFLRLYYYDDPWTS